MTTAISGTFTATGNSAGFVPTTARLPVSNKYNCSVWGTFVGTAILERSFDGGTTYIPLFTVAAITAPGSYVIDEPEAGVLHRLRCSAYTSGTISYRLSN